MMRFSILPLIAMLLVGCGPHPDSIKLDALLTNRIDVVEFSSSASTPNIITGLEAQKFITSLQKTNRIKHSYTIKSQVQQVHLRAGTNRIGVLHLDDYGTWHFGKYYFRLRQ